MRPANPLRYMIVDQIIWHKHVITYKSAWIVSVAPYSPLQYADTLALRRALAARQRHRPAWPSPDPRACARSFLASTLQHSRIKAAPGTTHLQARQGGRQLLDGRSCELPAVARVQLAQASEGRKRTHARVVQP